MKFVLQLGVVEALLKKLQQLNGDKTEGIFRVNGNQQTIHKILKSVQKGKEISSRNVTAFDVADSLKRYLRELSEPLLGSRFQGGDPVFLKQLMDGLDKTRHETAKRLFGFFKKVTENKKVTKLDSTAVGGCVSFSLCGERKRESKDKPVSAEDELAYTEATCFAIAVTIECYNYIFEGGPLKLPSISTRPLFSSLDVGEHSDDLPKLLAALSSWSAVVDPETNQCYYCNAETNTTTWEKPNELMFRSGWIPILDPRQNHYYFYNETTGETTWSLPRDFTELYEVIRHHNKESDVKSSVCSQSKAKSLLPKCDESLLANSVDVSNQESAIHNTLPTGTCFLDLSRGKKEEIGPDNFDEIAPPPYPPGSEHDFERRKRWISTAVHPTIPLPQHSDNTCSSSLFPKKSSSWKPGFLSPQSVASVRSTTGDGFRLSLYEDENLLDSHLDTQKTKIDGTQTPLSTDSLTIGNARRSVLLEPSLERHGFPDSNKRTSVLLSGQSKEDIFNVRAHDTLKHELKHRKHASQSSEKPSVRHRHTKMIRESPVLGKLGDNVSDLQKADGRNELVCSNKTPPLHSILFDADVENHETEKIKTVKELSLNKSPSNKESGTTRKSRSSSPGKSEKKLSKDFIHSLPDGAHKSSPLPEEFKKPSKNIDSNTSDSKKHKDGDRKSSHHSSPGSHRIDESKFGDPSRKALHMSDERNDSKTPLTSSFSSDEKNHDSPCRKSVHSAGTKLRSNKTSLNKTTSFSINQSQESAARCQQEDSSDSHGQPTLFSLSSSACSPLPFQENKDSYTVTTNFLLPLAFSSRNALGQPPAHTQKLSKPNLASSAQFGVQQQKVQKKQQKGDMMLSPSLLHNQPASTIGLSLKDNHIYESTASSSVHQRRENTSFLPELKFLKWRKAGTVTDTKLNEAAELDMDNEAKLSDDETNVIDVKRERSDETDNSEESDDSELNGSDNEKNENGLTDENKLSKRETAKSTLSNLCNENSGEVRKGSECIITKNPSNENNSEKLLSFTELSDPDSNKDQKMISRATANHQLLASAHLPHGHSLTTSKSVSDLAQHASSHPVLEDGEPSLGELKTSDSSVTSFASLSRSATSSSMNPRRLARSGAVFKEGFTFSVAESSSGLVDPNQKDNSGTKEARG